MGPVFTSQQDEMDRDKKASPEATWPQCDLTKRPGLLYRRKDRRQVRSVLKQC